MNCKYISTVIEDLYLCKGKNCLLWNELHLIIFNPVSLYHIQQIKFVLLNKLSVLEIQSLNITLDIVDFIIEHTVSYTLLTYISDMQFLLELIHYVNKSNDKFLQYKLLYLIVKWRKQFKNNIFPITTFENLYCGLLSKGIIFPKENHSSCKKIHTFSNGIKKLVNKITTELKHKHHYSKLIEENNGNNNSNNF